MQQSEGTNISPDVTLCQRCHILWLADIFFPLGHYAYMCHFAIFKCLSSYYFFIISQRHNTSNLMLLEMLFFFSFNFILFWFQAYSLVVRWSYTLCRCSYLATVFINPSAEILELEVAIFLSLSYTKIPCLWRNENLRTTFSTGMGIWSVLRWVSLEQKIKVMEG